jgi:hypothetical protein
MSERTVMCNGMRLCIRLLPTGTQSHFPHSSDLFSKAGRAAQLKNIAACACDCLLWASICSTQQGMQPEQAVIRNARLLHRTVLYDMITLTPCSACKPRREGCLARRQLRQASPPRSRTNRTVQKTVSCVYAHVASCAVRGISLANEAHSNVAKMKMART